MIHQKDTNITRLMNNLKYANGDKMPRIGLGTWKSKPGEVKEAVVTAIKAGYRHIDCAAIYQNEKEVGEALAECFENGYVSRRELWITSKLWNSKHKLEDVIPALQQTLNDLNLDYLDLYLIHWPIALAPNSVFAQSGEDFLTLDEVPLTETWQGMINAKHEGLTRHIGVSNFNIPKIQQLMDAFEEHPEMNQVEMHPYLQQKELFDFCANNGIFMTAYSPLGSGDRTNKSEDEPPMLEDPAIAKIAADHACSNAQVLIAWSSQRGNAVIPKSVTPSRIIQNLQAREIELSEEEMQTIANLDRNYRFIDGSFWTIEGSPYSLKSLWEE